MNTKGFKRKVAKEQTRKRLEKRLEEVRDLMGDLRRLIDQWERWEFDASEAWERLEELAVEEGEITDWLLNN